MPDNAIELLRDGKPLFAIHRQPWQRAEDMLDIVDDLARCLELSFDCKVPMARFDVKPTQPVTLALRLDPTFDLDLEGFEVRAAEQTITLTARSVEGLSPAVYWFLEKSLGARWLWPGETGEVIPKHRDLVFPCGKWWEAPDYAWRRVGVSGPVHEAMDYRTTMQTVHGVSLQYLNAFDRWCRRNRFGGLNVADGHRFVQIAPPEVYGITKPHIYALVDGQRDTAIGDGKHGNQPCLAHPETTAIMADYASAVFDADRDLDAFSIALNDGGRMCQCDACRAIDAEAGAAAVRSIEHFDRATDEAGDTARTSQPSATDRVIHQANRVIERVALKHPDRKLLILLYSHYRRPPQKFHLDPRVIGQYCLMCSAFWDDKARDTELARLREMHQSVPSLGIYEYYSQGMWNEAHRLFPHLVEQSVRAYYEAGARFFATQPTTGFATSGLNLFVLGRCLWDIDAKADDVIDDFCHSGFGPAAMTVRSYLTAFADRWRETRGAADIAPRKRYNTFHIPPQLYPPAFLKARQTQLDRAAVEAGNDEPVARRIEFLQKGLDYTRSFVQTCAATIAVLDNAGLDDQLMPTGPAAGVDAARFRNLVAAALDAWRAHWDFVHRESGKFIFGEFWASYRFIAGNEYRLLMQRLKLLAARGFK